MNALLSVLGGTALGAVAGGVSGWCIALFARSGGPDGQTGAAFLMLFLVIWGALLGGAAGLYFRGGFAIPILAVPLLCMAAGSALLLLGDREPKIDGKLLEMEFELRTPPEYALPIPDPGCAAYARLTGKDKAWRYHLRAEDFADLGGGKQVRAIVPLETSARNLQLVFFLGREADQAPDGYTLTPQASFLVIPEKLSRRDLEWRDWEAGGKGLQLRYRLKFREASAPGGFYYSAR